MGRPEDKINYLSVIHFAVSGNRLPAREYREVMVACYEANICHSQVAFYSAGVSRSANHLNDQ